MGPGRPAVIVGRKDDSAIELLKFLQDSIGTVKEEDVVGVSKEHDCLLIVFVTLQFIPKTHHLFSNAQKGFAYG